MSKVLVTCIAFAALIALSACRSSADKAAAREEKKQQQSAEMKASIPADSPLAKLQYGMSPDEVIAILGTPTSQDMHMTGKQFIPFNFAGKDSMRTVYYYKGIGRVEFSSGSWGQRNGVVVMDADTSAPGQRK